MSTPSTRESLTSAAPGEVQIARALLSVSDKTGILEFARGLADLGIEIISTGGTASALAEAGIPVRSITELTGFPEIMDGRVKTLNPKLYASLLAVRSNPEHVAAAVEHDVEPVDMVCVNLYPFERTAATRGVTDAEVIENIDIGGPTMIRAAAKNFAFTAPVTSPAAYDAVLEELRASERRLSMETRRSLAAEAFALTARYDSAITRWFQEQENATFPAQIVRAFEKTLDLPHGENPHQRASLYTQVGTRTSLLSMVAQLGGRELTYTNLLDLDAVQGALGEFVVPACAIVAHGVPTGIAVAASPLEAYRRALAADPNSAYGSVIAFNRRVDRELAQALSTQFLEVIFARGYDEDALDLLLEHDGLRVLDNQERRGHHLTDLEIATRQVRGGLLVQDRDLEMEDREAMQVVSERRPTEAEWSALTFAWKVVKHVRSNAIVIAGEATTLGIGAGQTTQVDAVRIALEKSQSSVEGAVLAADAPFPFLDGPQLAIDAGICAIIQPGGSEHDPGIVELIDAAGLAMVFTGRRHFRH
ncbi:MAG TPA: bifunctional phosphoribosylaminoimidazolecarboxamide formyltransferase/IMP cyclohydrolase [Solirubrobacteraceae bacterium]|nr:bifunctional phosphoribosylaminoimidazolecarboxamide formyltransferase/IMP cyclohydrolase [Solirubrobacteraceae bacterium]